MRSEPIKIPSGDIKRQTPSKEPGMLGANRLTEIVAVPLGSRSTIGKGDLPPNKFPRIKTRRYPLQAQDPLLRTCQDFVNDCPEARTVPSGMLTSARNVAPWLQGTEVDWVAGVIDGTSVVTGVVGLGLKGSGVTEDETVTSTAFSTEIEFRPVLSYKVTLIIAGPSLFGDQI